MIVWMEVDVDCQTCVGGDNVCFMINNTIKLSQERPQREGTRVVYVRRSAARPAPCAHVYRRRGDVHSCKIWCWCRMTNGCLWPTSEEDVVRRACLCRGRVVTQQLTQQLAAVCSNGRTHAIHALLKFNASAGVSYSQEAIDIDSEAASHAEHRGLQLQRCTA